MTDKEIQDKAYMIATGNHLTTAFSKKEFLLMSNTELNSYLSEDFIWWPITTINKRITSVAEDIIRDFSNV